MRQNAGFRIMDVSITIASYNSCDLTRRVLESIFENTQGIEYEVIVVDNASADGSADMIERLFPCCPAHPQ